jgi:hypothetical protein
MVAHGMPVPSSAWPLTIVCCGLRVHPGVQKPPSESVISKVVRRFHQKGIVANTGAGRFASKRLTPLLSELLEQLGHKIATLTRATQSAFAMEMQYCVNAPIRAIFNRQDGEQVSVTIPAGAVLVRFSSPQEKSTTLLGMTGVYWEGRHYSVYPNDLALKADRVQSA